MNFMKPERGRTVFYFVIVLVVVGAFWGLGNFSYTREVSITNGLNEVLPVSFKAKFTLAEKIEDGKELLKNSEPLKYNSNRKQIALAILDKNTGEVFEHRVWVRNSDVENYKKTGRITLEPDSNSFNQNGETINLKVNWWNSFNTDYEMPENPDLVVVANKYPFPSSYLAGLPEKSDKLYSDIIYVPYSRQLHVPELIKIGADYLDKNIEQAFSELNEANVSSLAESGTMVTNGVGKNFIKNILLIEHIDPDSFIEASDGGLEAAERVLVVIGGNRNSAYRYTGSPAGASGLAQFIKPTYDLMAAKYPQAELIRNYNAGMANHVNAIKAMVLFFDSHKDTIADKITRPDIVRSLGITEEMLAAAYNGGPSRVVSSVNRWGLAWFNGQVNLSNTGKILRQETLNYVKKFQAIRGLDLLANISID